MNRKFRRTAFICYKIYFVIFYFVNIFTVTFGQFNASLLNKSINLYKKLYTYKLYLNIYIYNLPYGDGHHVMVTSIFVEYSWHINYVVCSLQWITPAGTHWRFCLTSVMGKKSVTKLLSTGWTTLWNKARKTRILTASRWIPFTINEFNIKHAYVFFSSSLKPSM